MKGGFIIESNKALRIFDGATVIVTGGASGIGRALAEGLAKRGCEAVLADLQSGLAEEVASGIRKRGGKATAVKTDVTDYSAMERVVKETVSRSGRLDYMFNNAGIVIGGNVSRYGIKEWRVLHFSKSIMLIPRSNVRPKRGISYWRDTPGKASAGGSWKPWRVKRGRWALTRSLRTYHRLIRQASLFMKSTDSWSGRFKKISRKFDRDVDIVWMQKML